MSDRCRSHLWDPCLSREEGTTDIHPHPPLYHMRGSFQLLLLEFKLAQLYTYKSEWRERRMCGHLSIHRNLSTKQDRVLGDSRS